jgi:nitrite reductase (NADH) small subunit
MDVHPTDTALHAGHRAAGRGDPESGRYFRYMAEFIGFTAADAELIRQTKPLVAKHLPGILAEFYVHLLRYPPTRSVFLKKDGTVDNDYVELRMRHQTNFWLRTAEGVFDDEYAQYVDYVGRAHTAHGADPNIYVAERYVIGMVGFVQHAVSNVLRDELLSDPAFQHEAEEAWDKLTMVILELLSRAYGNERVAEKFEPLVPVDSAAVEALADRAYELEAGDGPSSPTREARVAAATDIPNGERRIVHVEGLSIGLFHHHGQWYALRNQCMHRGGPVCTGTLEGDILTCPWHGFQYNLTTGALLADPLMTLDRYAVAERNGEIFLAIPDIAVMTNVPESAPAPREEAQLIAAPTAAPQPDPVSRPLAPNEFWLRDIPAGQFNLVRSNGEGVVVYNVGGTFYATQSECPHAFGPLEEGTLDGSMITCPLHGSCFDVTTGAVLMGPAEEPLKTYRVVIEGDVGRVES